METQQASALEVKELSAANSEIARLTKMILAMQEATQAAAAADVANVSRASTKERWAIIVDESPDATDLSFVPVGVNGRVYQITRGRVVEVPPEVLVVLNHAVLDKSFTKVDSVTGMPNGADVRKVRRFPYQKLGKAVDAEGNRVETYEDPNQEVL